MAFLSFLLVGRCTFNETLTVSGAGSFFFDYRNPYLYVIDQGTSGNSVFHIYDMSDPSGPVLKSSTNLPNGSNAAHPRAHALAGYGTICLIPYFDTKVLAIWNVNDASAPVLHGSVSLPFSAKSVDAIGTKACIGYWENFLQTRSADRIDISNPAAPAIDASYSASQLVEEVRASDANFFLGGQNNSSGPTHLTCLRASDFALRDTAISTGGFAGINAGAIKLNSGYTRAFGVNLGASAIESWDISDPTNIFLIQKAAILPATGSTGCIAIKESISRAYVGRGGGGSLELSIVNISDPSNMIYAGAISTSGETVTDVAVWNDGCATLAWGQGTGAAIHLVGTAPTS